MYHRDQAIATLNPRTPDITKLPPKPVISLTVPKINTSETQHHHC